MKTIADMKKSINEAENNIRGADENEKSSSAPTKNATETGEPNEPDGAAAPDDGLAAEIAELRKRLSDAEGRNIELLDKYQRALAEFDNFRKRTAKEKSSIYYDGASDIIKRLLPVIDSLERAVSSIPDTERESPAYTGLTLIYKQLRQFMEENGISEIEAIGNKFDPALHEALAHAEDPGFGENEITEELQKGYTLNDKVIRHSMVKVAN